MTNQRNVYGNDNYDLDNEDRYTEETDPFAQSGLGQSQQEIQPAEEATIISADTVITGTITSDCNLVVHGTVKGDISTTANMQIFGNVDGNVTASSLLVDGGKITATKVLIDEQITVINDAEITADVKGNNISLNATIYGNIVADSNLDIHGASLIEGNVETNGISVALGAKIKGNVNIL